MTGQNMVSLGWRAQVHRLREQAGIPALLLLLALATVFAFQPERNGFLPRHHGYLSSHGMTLAENLSPARHFLLFNKMSREPDGTVHYEVYNRFPIGAFAAIRLVTLPFDGKLRLELLAARLLMCAFFVAAAVFAYLSVVRLAGNKWVALAATLLALSSYYCLHYSDMVFNDVPALFGILLVFHGMVVFFQEGRFRQLVIRSCIALFLGWQAYALLLPFVVLGCLRELRAARSLRSAVRSGFFLLGVVSLAFGAVILAGNLINESWAVKMPLRDLPTFRTMLWRLGLGGADAYDSYATTLSWPAFLGNQVYRLGRMSIPDILVHYTESRTVFAVLGVCVLLASLLAIARSRNKILIGSLVLSVPCWALPMRHFVAFHDFQCMFYVGVTLVSFCMVAQWVQRAGRAAGIGLAIAAWVLFSLSSLHLALVKVPGTDANEAARVADFQRIVDRVGTGHTIYVDGDYDSLGGAQHALGFYLAGNYFQPSESTAEFVLSGRRLPDRVPLTPANTQVLLYRGSDR
jgi:hypothetical protein